MKRISMGGAGVLGLVALGCWVGLSKLTPANYLPHRYCYLAKPGLIWTNAVSDSLIAISYAALFVSLFYLASKFKGIKAFHGYLWILIGFGLFIAACGLTHVMETVTVWWALYPLATAIKIVCAAVSVPTAVLFACTAPSLSGNIEHLLESLAIAKRETESEAATYREQIEAIDRSQMMLELDMDGTIVKANANYLSAFGYKDFELIGKHHSSFLSEEYKRSDEYQNFWRELRAGRYQAGQFCRFDKKGNEVWIEASYNPILDQRGVAVKVVKFASNVTDRVKVQNDLKDAEARLQAVVDNVVDGIITADSRGTIISMNVAALKIFGYEIQDLIGKNVKLLMPEPDRRAHDGHLASYQPEGSSRTIGVGRELEGLDRAGRVFPIELTISDFSFQGRRMFVGVIRDITERKQQEETLRRTREILDRTGRIAQVGGWEIDLASNEVFWSAEMYRLTGVEGDQPPTLEEGILLYSEDAQPIIKAGIEKAIADRRGFALDLPLIRPDGRQVWTRVTSTVECEGDKPVRLVGALQDVTDRILERAALQEANNRVKLATEGGGIGIWDWDMAKKTLTCDPLLFQLYGVSNWDKRELSPANRDYQSSPAENDGETIAQVLHRHVHPDDRHLVVEALRNSVENDQPYGIMFRVIWDDKSVHHLRAAGNVLHNESGRAVRMLAVNWDVTELVRANETSAQALEMAKQSNRAKSDFLANMSHEIRTPMNAILGIAYLARRAAPNAKLVDYLDKIGNAAQSLLSIVNDILDFSKIEAGKLELEVINFSLPEVLRNLLDVVGQKAQDKGLDVESAIADGVPAVLVGDPLRLGQILINLTNNAIKFTNVGKIAIRAVAEDISATHLRLSISVADTGIGMTAEQVATLFQPFNQGDTSFTRKYGGTGLGLAICNQLTDLMGGEIRAESELGKGSTFHFTATFGIAKEIAPTSLAPKAIALQHKSVLVVDDSEGARHSLLTMLEHQGLRTRAVSSGEEALSALARAYQMGDPVDLVLLDWRLPGIDGVETARRIKADPNLSRLPALLMVSAFDREEIFADRKDNGFDGFLSKPVSEKQLEERVAAALGAAHEPEALEISDGSAPEAASTLTGRHVLLVEDNEVNRFLAAELLSNLGIVVTNAVNGREGVDRVDAEPFDLVLMDIQMPVMDGLEATMMIRKQERFQHLPIIATTAHAMSGDRERSLAAGMNDHLTKPINPDLLTEVLTRWMPEVPAQRPATERPIMPSSPENEMPEQLPPFDLPAALLRANGKPELLRRMMLSFRNQFESAPSELRQEITEGKTEEAGRLAHSLKGVAATLEAKDLAEAAASIEGAIRDGVTQGLETLIARMQELLEPAIAAAGTVDRRAPAPVAQDTQPTRAEMTILLVDDQSGYLDLLKDVFGSHTQVLYASDGPAALQIAGAKAPDLILLDVMMAGMDGYEVFDRLHANPLTRDVPVIFLTGLGSVAEETKGLKMGAADYVTKPINPLVVRTRVTHQVELRRTQQQLMRKTTEEHAEQLAREEARAKEIARLGEHALQLRDEFLSHVSHELRSPLNSIYSFSSIIADGLAGKTTHEQDDYLLIILKNARQLQAMIEDLLAVTASKNGKLAVVPQETLISEAILDAVHTCEANAREKRINLSCTIPPSLPTAYADPVRVLQVLTILCDNAIKFTPEGGSVKVQMKMFDKVPGYLLVEVSDTGRGIKPQHLDRIFEHLYQVTDVGPNGRRGLGLGLHIARELMTRQGGSIWATSAQGAGSVFSFTVPVFAGQTAETPVPA
ncbi:MAG: response regulator [Acidobacteriaceae bacterium]